MLVSLFRFHERLFKGHGLKDFDPYPCACASKYVSINCVFTRKLMLLCLRLCLCLRPQDAPSKSQLKGNTCMQQRKLGGYTPALAQVKIPPRTKSTHACARLCGEKIEIATVILADICFKDQF